LGDIKVGNGEYNTIDEFNGWHRSASENILSSMKEPNYENKVYLLQMAREYEIRALDIANTNIQRHLAVDLISAVEHMKIEIMGDKYERDFKAVYPNRRNS
jgi:hypothetical protein